MEIVKHACHRRCIVRHVRLFKPLAVCNIGRLKSMRFCLRSVEEALYWEKLRLKRRDVSFLGEASASRCHVPDNIRVDPPSVFIEGLSASL
jgi:hypothetical protein